MYRFHKAINIDTSIDKSLVLLCTYFGEANKELYLVGGCVRDLLLNKKPKDYDLCTNATPEEIKSIIEKANKETKHKYGSEGYSFIETGIKHGTVTVHDRFLGQFYEITTYRVDGKYSDNRHPDTVTFTPNLEEDLKRRDFTINSFAYDLGNNEVIMLDESFLDDLQYGIIRCVGEAEQRFTEDALRMLRAFRFAAQYGFILETDTYEAIKTCAPLMVNISKERIRDELTKILLSNNPRYLEFIIAAGLEPYLFDGRTPMTDMINCPHQNPYHYTDVFHHTLDVIERVPATFNLRWAALFHDIGKPTVKALKPGTTDHYRYLGHNKISEQFAVEFMQICKFSNANIDIISKYVRYHDDELAECKMGTFRKVLNDIGPENFLEFMKLREADSSAHCLILQTKYAIKNINICYDRYRKVMSEPTPLLTVKQLAVDGNDLLTLGYKGKAVGDSLNYLLDIVLENPALNTKERLIRLLEDRH